MRVVVQRCKESSVTINGIVKGKIDFGYTLLVGFQDSDDYTLVDKMIDKIINLRVFEDNEGKMNYSLLDVNGSILNISQFTLYADVKKGRRPSFTMAGNPSYASQLYDYMNEKITSIGINVQTGCFGEDMKVSIINDGPVTILLDSDELF